MARRSHRARRVANEIRQLRACNTGHAISGAWQESGSLDIRVRANAIWKQLLNEYEQPPLDIVVDEALVEYVDKRKKFLMTEH